MRVVALSFRSARVNLGKSGETRKEKDSGKRHSARAGIGGKAEGEFVCEEMLDRHAYAGTCLRAAFLLSRPRRVCLVLKGLICMQRAGLTG